MNLDEHLLNGQAAIEALLAASRDPDPIQAGRATQHLLLLAAGATAGLESTVGRHLPLLKETSKNYSVFPINVSAPSGRDTKQKLELVGMLPVGANLPFKRLRGAARNDRLWSLIEDYYWVPSDAEPTLPLISKRSARVWAKAIAAHYLGRHDHAGLLGRLEIDGTPVATKRAARRKKTLVGDYGGIALESVKVANGTRFFVRTTCGKRGRELSAMEATHFSNLLKNLPVTEPTVADRGEEFTDMLEKRLRQRLKA